MGATAPDAMSCLLVSSTLAESPKLVKLLLELIDEGSKPNMSILPDKLLSNDQQMRQMR